MIGNYPDPFLEDCTKSLQAIGYTDVICSAVYPGKY